MENLLEQYMKEYCECYNDHDYFDYWLDKYTTNMMEKCTYEDIYDEVNDTDDSKPDPGFSFLHLNIQSLPGKYDKFKNLLNLLQKKHKAGTSLDLQTSF